MEAITLIARDGWEEENRNLAHDQMVEIMDMRRMEAEERPLNLHDLWRVQCGEMG